MKQKYLTLKVAEPCSENWNNMHPQGQTRFCDSCQKQVIDFSLFSDVQLAQFFASEPENVCGRFLPSQLNRSIELPIPTRRWQTLKMAGLLAAGLMMGTIPVPAQQQAIPTEQVQFIDAEENPDDSSSGQEIRGQVVDQHGAPLILATVLLFQNEVMIQGTYTDIEGYFTLKKSPKTSALKLQISYVGYETKELSLQEPAVPLSITMQTMVANLPMAEVVGFSVPLVEIGTAMGLTVIHHETKEKPAPEVEPDSEPDPFLPYPNPFKDQFQVNVVLEQASTLLFHLYNNNGQLIHAESQELLAGEQSIPLSERVTHLAAGTYYLRIADSEKELAVRKVVKVR